MNKQEAMAMLKFISELYIIISAPESQPQQVENMPTVTVPTLVK